MNFGLEDNSDSNYGDLNIPSLFLDENLDMLFTKKFGTCYHNSDPVNNNSTADWTQMKILNELNNTSNYNSYEEDLEFQNNEKRNYIEFFENFTPPKKIFDEIEDDNMKLISDTQPSLVIPEQTIKATFKTVKNVSSRKKKPDGIRKKIKVGFHQFLHKRLNLILGKIRNKTLVLSKLPQNFISDITIAYNSKLISKTIYEIYYEFSEEENNRIILDAIFKNNLETEELRYFLKTITYEQAYMQYLCSQHFQDDMKKVKNKINNDEYYQKYVELSNNYVDYFKIRQPNKKKETTN